MGGPVGVVTLQRLCYSGLSLNEGVGGAESLATIPPPFFCLFVFFSLVHCYSNYSKITFQFAQIYNHTTLYYFWLFLR